MIYQSHQEVMMRRFLPSVLHSSVVLLAYLLLNSGGVARNAALIDRSSQVQTAEAGRSDKTGQVDESKRIHRPTSEPYKGKLSIFEDPKRAEKLQIERVMDVLVIKEGRSVADIGAGSGWFTVRAASRVGNSGTVYAVEINQSYLEYIRKRAVAEGFSNIRTVLGKEDDPLLPSRSVDAVLILKAYHEIAQPILLLSHLTGAMRDGALLGIIDRNGRGDDHGLDSKIVIKEAQQAGFSLVEQFDFVKPDGMDYFLVFKVRSEPSSPNT